MKSRSWIIPTVVGPVIVGLVLLLIEYSFFSNGSTKDAEIEEKAGEIVEKIGQDKEDRDLVGPERLKTLESLFASAQRIYGTPDRDAEYSKIIDLALQINHPEFAYRVAQELYSTPSRDSHYVKIIDKSLVLGKYEFAMEVAEDIYGTPDRNAQYRKIVEAGAQVLGQDSSNK